MIKCLLTNTLLLFFRMSIKSLFHSCWNKNNSFLNLPKLIMSKILNLLTMEDIKTLSLVSRKMNEEISDPILWRKFHLCFKSVDWRSSSKALNSGKFRFIENIYFENINCDKIETMIEVIMSFEYLKSVDFTGTQFSSGSLHPVSEDIITILIQNVQTLYLQDCNLTVNQLSVIFQNIQTEGKLKHLYIVLNRFNELNPLSFSNGVNLKTFHCENCNITPLQLHCFLQRIEENNALTDLNLSGNLMSEINSSILSRSLRKIKYINVWNVRADFNEFFMDIFMGLECFVEKLFIGNNSFRNIPPHILAHVIAKMNTVDMNRCSMKDSQLNSLIKMLRCNSNNLKHLVLGGIFDEKIKCLFREAAAHLDKFEMY